MAQFTNEPAGLSLDQPIPLRQTLTWFARYGQLRLKVANNSSVATCFNLEVSDQADACRFELVVPARYLSHSGSLTLSLSAGESMSVLVLVRPRSRPFFGLRRQTYFCTLTLANLRRFSQRQTALAQLTWSPWLSSIILMILLLVIGTTLIKAWPQHTLTPPPLPLSQPVQSPPAPLWSLVNFNLAGAPANSLTPAALPDSPLTPVNFDPIFKRAAQTYHLDWQILARQGFRESHLNPIAIGRFSELGLMQIRPSTWREWAPKVGVTDPFDSLSNVQVAAAYLAHLKQHFSRQGYGETQWMLTAYIWGPNNLQQLLDQGGGWAQVPTAVRQYVTDILQATPAGELTPSAFSQSSFMLPNCPVKSLTIGQHISASGSFTETETTAAGPIACRIEPGSCPFKLLVSNLDPTIIFKQEEAAPYDTEDKAMHPAMLLPLYRLNRLVQAEWGGSVHLRITDAYDSLLEHDLSQPNNKLKMSLHFEGRATDLTTWPIEPDHYGRLCALAYCAGFDWVHHEGDHCHAVIKAESLCMQCKD